MKIKKTFQGELPENRVVNTYSDSLTDAYSANYLNDKLRNVEVSSTEPTNGKDIWVQIGKNLFDKTKIISNLSPTSDGGFTGASGCSTSYVKVNPGDTYMVSSNVERPWVFNFSKDIPSIGVVATPWNIANGNAFQVVVPDGFEYISFRHLPSSPGEDNINQDIQVEQGEFKTDYEPYMPKKIYVKKDNKYELVYDEANTKKEVYVGPTEPKSGEEVWVQRSKNRFNKNNYIKDRGSFLGFNIELEEGKEYTISCDKKIYAVKFARYSTQNDGQQGPQTWSSFYSWTFVASKQTRLFISVKADQTMVKDISELADYNIQIERGEVATKFEDYIDDKIYTKNENGAYDEFFKKDKYRYNHLEGEDVLIGTWYGKPVYRHITDTTVQSNSTYNETCVYTNKDMDKVIDLRGMVAYDNGVHQIGAYANTNFYSLLQYNSSSKKVFFYGANNYVGKVATVIIEYTKTTD